MALPLNFGLFYRCTNGIEKGRKRGKNPTLNKIRLYCNVIGCPFLKTRPRRNKHVRQLRVAAQDAQQRHNKTADKKAAKGDV